MVFGMPGNVKEARVSLTPSEVVPIEHIFPSRGQAGYGPAILPMNLPQVSVQGPPLCMFLFFRVHPCVLCCSMEIKLRIIRFHDEHTQVQW